MNDDHLIAMMSPTLDRMSEHELLVLSYASYLGADHIPIAWLRELAAETLRERCEQHVMWPH